MTTEIKGGLLAQVSDSQACQRCEGRGVLYDEEALDCDACGGSGRVVAAQAVFTPGPWSVRRAVCRNDHPDTSADVHGRDGQFVADCGCHEQATANAMLIATTPDLREIARKLILFFGDVPPDEIPVMVMEDPSTVTQFVVWARAALAKAEGRSAPTAPPSPSSPALDPQETK